MAPENTVTAVAVALTSTKVRWVENWLRCTSWAASDLKPAIISHSIAGGHHLEWRMVGLHPLTLQFPVLIAGPGDDEGRLMKRSAISIQDVSPYWFPTPSYTHTKSHTCRNVEICSWRDNQTFSRGCWYRFLKFFFFFFDCRSSLEPSKP